MCLIWPGKIPGQAVFGTERFRGPIVRVTSPDAPVPAAPALAAFYLPDTKKIRDAIHIRPTLYLTLTFDHRILDGAAADRFLSEVVHLLENWPH